MTAFAIETHELTKTFGTRSVVDGLSLAVPQGSVFGFLGPNGSGKTTTVRMLLGLAFASSGTISVLGQSMPQAGNEVLPQVGAMVEGPAFYPYLTGRQNLERMDALARTHRHGAARAKVDEALDRVGLGHAADKKFKAYSLGMRQRLGLANALMYKRELLILDEPTNGLDPQGTREVRNLIRSLHEDGTTVFLSSHLLSEIDQVCTHAAVISAGKTVAQGAIEELRQGRKNLVRVETPDLTQAEVLLRAEQGVISVEAEPRIAGDGWLNVELGAMEPEAVAALLVHAGVRLRSMTNERPTLEEAFVALTGEGFDVAE